MKATAWILSVTPNLFVAVGEFELVHILPDNPVLFKVPKSPGYCNQVFVWQNKIIPLMDLAARFEVEGRGSGTNEGYKVGIVAYRAEKTGVPGYGALFLKSTPRQVEVGDEQGIVFPASFEAWHQYVSSCFKTEDTEEAIMILRLNRLFAEPDCV